MGGNIISSQTIEITELEQKNKIEKPKQWQVGRKKIPTVEDNLQHEKFNPTYF